MDKCEDESEMDTAETLSSDSDSDEADDIVDEEQQKKLWLKVEECRKQVSSLGEPYFLSHRPYRVGLE